MHDTSYKRMKENIEEFFDAGNSMIVADLGSYDVNGTYKDLVVPTWEYVGIDLIDGPNVDLVMADTYTVPVGDNYFDALISGQCLEHTKNPFKLMKEASRVVKSGGLVLITAPFIFFEHRYPIDCWRFLVDGFEALFDESGIYVIKLEYCDGDKEGRKDTWGIGGVK